MDAVTLSRIQFGVNICFHYLFPPLSIGLALILVLMEGTFLCTKNAIYEKMTHFWVKVFALIFAMGVATGLVMVFSFGTNWSNFSKFVGDVFGSLLGAEGIFAFFLESGFLGILLFGWHRVSPKVHFLSTVMVAVGSHFSAIWIVIANSWMQTPAGHKIVGEGAKRHAIMGSFSEVVFNPSSLDRLIHVILGCWLCGAFLVLSVSAYYLLKKKHIEFASKSLKIALWVAAVCVVLQFFSGDSSGKGVAKNQPIKLAAFEGAYKTEVPTRMYLGGVVDAEKKEVKGIKIPGLLSLMIFHNLDEGIPGLETVDESLWPNVPIVFQTFHGMVAMWGLMVLAVVMTLFAIYRKKLLKARITLWLLVISVAFPEIANQLGWCSAEMGRQPWSVQNLLKTQEAASPNVKAAQVVSSLVMFSLIYLLLFVLFIYLLDRKIKLGPERIVETPEYRDKYET